MKKSIVLIFGLLLFSCNNSEEYEKIEGEWKCSEWITESTGEDRCKNNVYFNFKKDKTYSSKISGLEESGVYKISNGLLYSTPTGKLEIGVEINKLNKDTLQFIMSRFGEKEILTLLRSE
ncbi:lipocalin family protein [Psychroserpens jangbogonensis]|uniref:lipocalin family protein n=1 Tax=Psychroserpens jangbogonensis TaxID=1484460 RepID=UPI00053E8106|nr:lipocalin family protein [Psychroserpens jangbogonensis]